jgi:hypothetical protein
VFLWVGPVLTACWCYALAGAAYFISRSPEETGRTAAAKLLSFSVREPLARATDRAPRLC